jgi:NADH-quinone oxidoreductase subunit L
MVTAGVFLMTRVNPVLEYASDWAPEMIAWVGAITALFAATIAVAQNDIKKVLAYSTVSQLGYMFLAVGTGAYVAAIFHMVTHAFFKALLFLGSGSVIHGMHHEQDMRWMGALRKLMPVTAATFIVGWLAIAGVPPLAGFWSKDEILLFALASSPALWAIGLVTAVLTAYYMTRQVVMVFFGEAKWESRAAEHGAHGEFKPHESPPVMLFPLVVLAGLAIVGGLIQLPSYAWIPDDLTLRLQLWLEPVVEFGETEIIGTSAYENRGLLAIIAIAAALIGIAAGIAVYAKHKAKAIEPQLLADGYRYDATVSAFMGGPGRKLFEAITWFDQAVIDGAVNGSARAVRGAARQIRKGQTGNIRNYAGILGIGAVLLLAWFVVARGVL